MIQTNELRIGNLVQSKSGKNYYLVAGISRLDFILSNEKTGLFSSHGCHVYGIPLTEEILLKCGFKLMGYTQQRDYIRLIYEDGGKLFFYAHAMRKIEIKYLHQLQNLYFALTGKELEIKL